jgi:hypothetical protein
MNMPSPKVDNIRPRPSLQTTQSLSPIKKSSETMSEPAPRVQNEKKTEKRKEKVNANKEQFRQNIRHTVMQCARIPQHHQMQLQMQEQTECAQLIYDKETGMYLNYRQLICNPKH